MKTKLLLIYSAVILAAGTFYSCSKDQGVSEANGFDPSVLLKFVSLQERIGNNIQPTEKERIIIVAWDEWGRAKRECKGWGLCNADWFPQFDKNVPTPVPPKGGSSILEFDPARGQYYFDILLAAFPPASVQGSTLSLEVDEDIVLDIKERIGNDLVIRQGTYDYDPVLSIYGGYRIYLDLQ